VPILEALEAADRAPLAVVTQPARPAGRKRTTRQPEAALWAREAGIELWQPERASDPGLLARLREQAPTWGVVAAYGEILRPALLEIPERAFLNVHASLLPAWRGASPIQAALAAGDPVTGVTIMEMAEGLDSGAIVLQRELAIAAEETAPELAERLARSGGRALVEALDGLEAGLLRPVPQDESRATWAPRLRRSDGEVSWEWPAATLHDRWRAYQPWPGVHARIAGEWVKLGPVRVVEGHGSEAPGLLRAIDDARVTVACGGASALEIAALQRPGKRLLPAAQVVRGLRLEVGDRLG
jgi:methionyl-tRNA formyltransferase